VLSKKKKKTHKNRTPANRLTNLTKSIARLLSIKVFRQSRMSMKNVIAAKHRRTSFVIDLPAARRPPSEASETEVLLATQAEWAHTSVATRARHYKALPAAPSNGLCARPIIKSCVPLALAGFETQAHGSNLATGSTGQGAGQSERTR
jgi:hypothetical protein